MKRIVLFVPLGVALVGGCSSSSIEQSTPSIPCPDPPGSAALLSRPDAPIASGPSTVFALSKLLLGDEDPDGGLDPTYGWKHIGYDIDHTASVANSCGLCAPLDGALRAEVYPDGNGGIDNSFGSLVLPLILGIDPNWTDETNQEIEGGTKTLLLRIDGLGSADSYGSMGGAFFHAGALGSAPKWDGTDVWPVTADSLLDPADPSSAKVTFKSSYLVANRWVSDPPSTVLMELPLFAFGAVHLHLVIHDAIFVVDVASDRSSGANGFIAGILDVNELAAESQRLWKDGDCSSVPMTLTLVAEVVSQAADILLDGSQDPTKSCSGISIGLGFEMKAAKIGAVVPAEPPDPDPCVDAGADGG